MDLFETQLILQEQEELNNNYIYNNKMMFNSKKFIGEKFLYCFKIICYILDLACFLYFFIDMISASFINALFESIFFTVIFSLILFVLFHVTKFILKIIHKFRKMSEQEEEEYNYFFERRKQIESNFTYLNNKLNDSEVPEQYRNFNTVNWMVNAYNNGRGNTYSELINLYEQEQYQIHQQQRLEQLYKQQEQANEKINSLQREAEKAKKEAESAKRSADMAWWMNHLK